MPQSFCKITTLDLSYAVPVKSTVIFFVAFSEYMNFESKSFLKSNTQTLSLELSVKQPDLK